MFKFGLGDGRNHVLRRKCWVNSIQLLSYVKPTSGDLHKTSDLGNHRVIIGSRPRGGMQLKQHLATHVELFFLAWGRPHFLPPNIVIGSL